LGLAANTGFALVVAFELNQLKVRNLEATFRVSKVFIPLHVLTSGK
jgi:hypothetical protein